MSSSTSSSITRRLRRFDSKYFSPDVQLLGGLDEAGRGALAGPVVAAIVVLEPGCSLPGVNDSKQLRAEERENFYHKILRKAAAVGVGWATAEEIDSINIYQGSLLAGRRAYSALQTKPHLLLTDALRFQSFPVPIEPIIHGDALSQAIAAASIIAKVTRDGWMRRLDEQYPGYGFASHKGYAVDFHWRALQELRASTLHRHTYRGVDWFDEEYRPSCWLQGMMEKLKSGMLSADKIEELWREQDFHLPECEMRILKNRAAMAEILAKNGQTSTPELALPPVAGRD